MRSSTPLISSNLRKPAISPGRIPVTTRKRHACMKKHFLGLPFIKTVSWVNSVFSWSGCNIFFSSTGASLGITRSSGLPRGHLPFLANHLLGMLPGLSMLTITLIHPGQLGAGDGKLVLVMHSGTPRRAL